MKRKAGAPSQSVIHFQLLLIGYSSLFPGHFLSLLQNIIISSSCIVVVLVLIFIAIVVVVVVVVVVVIIIIITSTIIINIKHNCILSGKKTVTGVQVVTAS